MKDLSGRWFVVTGGASGLGLATTRRLVQEGAKVLIIDVNVETGGEAQKELNRNTQSSQVLFQKCNITSEEDTKKALNEAKKVFKGSKLGGAVNCAGIASASTVVSGKRGAFPLKLFQRTLDINVNGTFNVLRLVSQEIMENIKEAVTSTEDNGVIVNTASVAAFDGQIGQAAYSASKGAVVSMTLPIARELGRYGIRVNCIAPGVFETNMTKMLPEKARKSLYKQVPYPNRFGHPEEFADLVLFMIKNQMINGEVVRLDGAIRMSSL